MGCQDAIGIRGDHPVLRAANAGQVCRHPRDATIRPDSALGRIAALVILMLQDYHSKFMEIVICRIANAHGSRSLAKK
jgi:hypothetical protein